MRMYSGINSMVYTAFQEVDINKYEPTGIFKSYDGIGESFQLS